MIEILLCDDNKHCCNYMEECISCWALENKCEVNIEQCYSGNSLRQVIKKERPHLLFLDLELGDETGEQVADYIRDVLGDEYMQIVFVSAHTHYSIRLFHIRPFDFVVKPISKYKLSRVLSNYCKLKIKYEKKYFTYKIKSRIIRIDFDDIIYCQSDRKKIRVFIKSSKDYVKEPFNIGDTNTYIEFIGSLKELMKQLEKSRFWWIHKSYVVNIDYVVLFERDRFILKDNIEIPVSRSRCREVAAWILKYVHNNNILR